MVASSHQKGVDRRGGRKSQDSEVDRLATGKRMKVKAGQDRQQRGQKEAVQQTQLRKKDSGGVDGAAGTR